MSDHIAVAPSLQVRPVAVPLMLQRREILPAAPGFYGWWPRRGVWRCPPRPTTSTDELSLLYIGISPARETSRQTIRSRVIGNHLNSNVGSSTFRSSSPLC